MLYERIWRMPDRPLVNEQDVLDRLRAAATRSTRGLAILGAVLGVLGGVILGVDLLGLDARLSEMSSIERFALRGCGAVLVMAALTMVVMGAFVLPRRSRALVGALCGDPAAVQSITHRVVRAAGASTAAGTHQLVAEVNGRRLALTLAPADVEPVFAYLRQRTPHAFS